MLSEADLTDTRSFYSPSSWATEAWRQPRARDTDSLAFALDHTLRSRSGNPAPEAEPLSLGAEDLGAGRHRAVCSPAPAPGSCRPRAQGGQRQWPPLPHTSRDIGTPTYIPPPDEVPNPYQVQKVPIQPTSGT